MTPQLPAGLPELPPVPDGYDRWEYRGTGWVSKGEVTYCRSDDDKWSSVFNYGGARGFPDHYIEAVRDESPADSDTPETDAQTDKYYYKANYQMVSADFARSLERRALAAETSKKIAQDRGDFWKKQTDDREEWLRASESKLRVAREALQRIHNQSDRVNEPVAQYIAEQALANITP